jgi:glycosyltransferase involved in cell wall biosynthesis
MTGIDEHCSPTSAKVCAIIPAYNEEANIAGTLNDLFTHQPEISAVVVDDASTDNTQTAARLPGVTVLSSVVNLGIGGAVQTGLRFARAEGYDIAIQFDGDGQHMAAEIAGLMAPIVMGEADAVCGSRFAANREVQIGWFRRLGIWLLRRVVSLLTGSPFTDPTSGFRAYGRKAVVFLADNYPQDYPEPESLVELHRNGFRIREIPVQMRPRVGGKSSIGRLDSAYYMTKVMLAVIVAATRRKIASDRKDRQ